MECSHCKYPHTHVVETKKDNESQIRRRRECLRCGMRFTTYERLKDHEQEKHNKERGK